MKIIALAAALAVLASVSVNGASAKSMYHHRMMHHKMKHKMMHHKMMMRHHMMMHKM